NTAGGGHWMALTSLAANSNGVTNDAACQRRTPARDEARISPAAKPPLARCTTPCAGESAARLARHEQAVIARKESQVTRGGRSSDTAGRRKLRIVETPVMEVGS